jgi:hypothetical protein
VQNEENFVNWDKPKQKYLPFQNQTITWRNQFFVVIDEKQ